MAFPCSLDFSPCGGLVARLKRKESQVEAILPFMTCCGSHTASPVPHSTYCDSYKSLAGLKGRKQRCHLSMEACQCHIAGGACGMGL